MASSNKLQFVDLPQDVQAALEQAALPDEPAESTLAIFRDVSARFPAFLPARMNLAATLLDSGQVAEARGAYEAVLADFPDERGAIAGLATVCSAEGDHAHALELADRAIALEYLWGPVLEARAKALEALGRMREATDAYLAAYRSEPHLWSTLQAYCRLEQRPYRGPMEDLEPVLNDDQLSDLFAYIDHACHQEGEDGTSQGCDHTLRFTTCWADANDVDVIDLYQFVNAHGGFCDCEVCLNVQPAMEEHFDAARPWWRRLLRAIRSRFVR